MPRAQARAWAASCKMTARTSGGVRRRASPLIMTSARWSLPTFQRPEAKCPQRGWRVSVPLAKMMTTAGISPCRPRMACQTSSRTLD